MPNRNSIVAIPHPNHPHLFLHGRRRDSGKFSCPGGGANVGEHPDETAHRELFEETGMKAKKLMKLRSDRVHDDKGVRDLTLYHAEPDHYNPTNEHDPDQEFSDDWQWLDPTTHPEMHIPSHKNILVHHLLERMHKSEDLLTTKKYHIFKGPNRLTDKPMSIQDIHKIHGPVKSLESKGFLIRAHEPKLKKDDEFEEKLKGIRHIVKTTKPKKMRIPLSDIHQDSAGVSNAHKTFHWTPDFKVSNKPVDVGVHVQNGKYHLLNGYHRALAAQKRGETHIMANVIPTKGRFGHPTTKGYEDQFFHEPAAWSEMSSPKKPGKLDKSSDELVAEHAKGVWNSLDKAESGQSKLKTFIDQARKRKMVEKTPEDARPYERPKGHFGGKESKLEHNQKEE